MRATTVRPQQSIKIEKETANGAARLGVRSVIYTSYSAMSALDVRAAMETTMLTRYLATLAITASILGCGTATALFAQSPSNSGEQAKKCYPPEYTSSGDFILPKNFHEWVFVGSPLTPNALNGGQANFPEFHNVYMEPCSYEKYKQTNVFPDGTIFFKELQLTLPGDNPDGSRTEPSGRGYFGGPLNGADSTVKDTKRYAATGGWGYYNFNHHEPKAPTAKLKPQTECAYCHQANAKKDDVWTQFYPLLDK
ncbi:MAG TPA: cytochrome P460 family protein [Pseudolabrys sp.]|nr:cytochrome P460 family protein [Pseudolabrys sp.]